MILDSLPDNLDPIVRVIDNFERNHKLGVAFEATVGQGKLLVCSCGLMSQRKYPEARQLLASFLHYMNSDDFDPSCSLAASDIEHLMRGSS